MTKKSAVNRLAELSKIADNDRAQISAEQFDRDISLSPPRFPWLDASAQADFELWFQSIDVDDSDGGKHGDEFEKYKHWPKSVLAAFLIYAEWRRDQGDALIDRLLDDLRRADTLRERDALIAEWNKRSVLAKGPAALRERTAALQKKFPDWKATASEMWKAQREACRNRELGARLYTYDEMAKHIQESHLETPRPSVRIINSAIAGLRPTLGGRLRKNSSRKNSSK